MVSFEDIILLEEIENIEREERSRRRRFSRNDAFDLSDELFVQNFRLSKNLVLQLIELLSPLMTGSRRGNGLDVKTKVLIALNFFGTGSYQQPVGCNLNMGVSQSTVSKAISEVVDALNHPSIFNEWVKFPSTIAELEANRNAFYTKYGYPGVVGCVDCTHVAIVPPSNITHDERSYVNRKHYHSINVQLICDAHLKIIHVNALFPGSTHDAYIWRNSNVEPLLETLYRQGQRGFYVLGDSGYYLRPWIITPISNTQPNTPEDRHNTTFRKVRSLIERCNGVLKMRFRCLLKHRFLHYKPEKATRIINACVVLHNMCIQNNEPEFTLEEGVNFDFGNILVAPINDHRTSTNADLVAGRAIQQRIVQNFFTT